VAALLLPPVTGVLKTAGHKRTRRWLNRLPLASRTASEDTLDTALLIGRCVTLAANHTLLPSTCLSRSLVTWILLRRRGIEGNIQLGVAKQDGKVAVHAWIEHRGVPINDAPDVAAQFSPFGN
jgi:hypothetical protein